MSKFKKALPILLGTSLLVGCSNEGASEPAKSEVQKEENTQGKEVTKTKNDQVEVKELTFTKEEAINEAKIVLEDNLKYFLTEDIENYLNTLNLDPETMEIAKVEAEQTFNNLDLVVSLEGNIVINSVSEDNKKVLLDVVQVTKTKEENENFNDNKVWATHTIEYIDGKWGITGTEINNAESIE